MEELDHLGRTRRRADVAHHELVHAEHRPCAGKDLGVDLSPFREQAVVGTGTLATERRLLGTSALETDLERSLERAATLVG
ncbi:hypothetical protein HRbin41_01271 [bacterium HR41]|nr:hypothetical protein HRbin41_01271 [bacterium HR41]